MKGDEDEEARRRRAEELRRELDDLARSRRPARAPRTPREFVEESMRERGTPDPAEDERSQAPDPSEPDR